MAWTSYQLFLAGLMVVTGSLNTLSTKWADQLKSINSVGELVHFNHPFLQATSMFVGEFSCMYAFFMFYFIFKHKGGEERVQASTLTGGNRQFNPLIFLPPAMCDMIATSTMYVGLNLTYASSFQMLRGSVIVFTGLLSMFCLGRKLNARQWAGIVFVIIGLAIVGVSDFLLPSDEDYDTSNVILGDALIIAAQVVVACQMVIEERFVSSANVPPLMAVGCEGLFGFVVLSILLFPMYHIHVNSTFSSSPEYRLEDALDAFYQLGNNWQLSLAFSGTIISIAFFNFAGISVTKEINATTRMVLDSVRTLVIYLVSLALGWQDFQYLQPIGFVILLIGMSVYNDVIITPFMRERGWIAADPEESEPPKDDSQEELAASGPDDDAAVST
ncbi:solute carrier family 35 member F6-like isoform X1 [Amphibalanus amphitrite]|uniref:solute carrier family 35 member F6-like isoform X1 n=1 Tax=Amphibalanus amphitrite TaxID=1232801 RepID=UPI001C8FE321|nr:solute carrier family 35 member F6-like isoform X1 [Amphibalanus amphitrite]